MYGCAEHQEVCAEQGRGWQDGLLGPQLQAFVCPQEGFHQAFLPARRLQTMGPRGDCISGEILRVQDLVSAIQSSGHRFILLTHPPPLQDFEGLVKSDQARTEPRQNLFKMSGPVSADAATWHQPGQGLGHQRRLLQQPQRRLHPPPQRRRHLSYAAPLL